MKKSDDGSLHDVDNAYYWAETFSPSIWGWIANVNTAGGPGFASHND